MEEKPIPPKSVSLPPADAQEFTTVCDYCSIGCGYKVFRWPVGVEGGSQTSQNAIRAKYPVKSLSGKWISELMHSKVFVQGKEHHVVVLPDPDARVVNLHGDHSIRGGGLAQKLYHPKKPTKDRLKYPMVRIKGKLVQISWDDAIALFANLTQYALEKFGSSSWAQKRYSYQYFENTYALSKLAWQVIQSPAYADHDNPGRYPATPGLKDAGVEPFSACYEDYFLAERLFISGSDPFETKTVLFNEWILRGVRERGNRLIFVNPRRTMGVQFGIQEGGLHLPILPGTDALLHLGLSRIILERGWEDREWIEEFTSRKVDHGFRKFRKRGRARWEKNFDTFLCEDFKEFRDWILKAPESKLDYVSKETGLSKSQIVEAAQMLAKPGKNGVRPKTSFVFEKGLYWSNNYLGTASLVSLALLCGAGNRPGRMISRLGGHQRGGMSIPYFPHRKSPVEAPTPHRKHMNLDEWVERGKVRFAWVVGTTWVNAMGASSDLLMKMKEFTSTNPHQPERIELEHLIEVFRKRMDSGGLFLVEQNIYQTRKLGQIADMILPAATWGECDFTRANSERRIRLYSKFMDPPGEALADWEIAARIARALGAEGFEWKDSNAVFEEAALASRKTVLSYEALLLEARDRQVTGHELLRRMGTEGIQAPVRLENGRLIGTARLHDSELQKDLFFVQKSKKTGSMSAFSTPHGRANFLKSPWSAFEDFYTHIRPRDGELWVINGRINEIWQSGFDDLLRRPFISKRWPDNFLEIHPEDGARLGIESGDEVEVTNNRVPVQDSSGLEANMEAHEFKNLLKAGRIRFVQSKVRAIALVQPVPRPGTTFMYCLHPEEMANSLVARVPDPISGNYRYKLGFGIVKRTGSSPYKEDLSKMSFVSRNLS